MTDKKIELSQFYVKKEELRDHNSSSEAHPDLRNAVSKSEIVNMIYPVGSIYMSTNNTSPAVLFGGTWKKIEGQFLLASGKTPNVNKTYTAGSSGGSKDSVLPSHSHTMIHGHTAGSHSHGTNSSNYSHFVMSHNDSNLTGGGPWKVTKDNEKGKFFVVYTENSWDINIYDSTSTGAAGVSINNFTGSTSSAGSGSTTDANMPPYLVVNVWERTK